MIKSYICIYNLVAGNFFYKNKYQEFNTTGFIHLETDLI
jgi:hypothetical protein